MTQSIVRHVLGILFAFLVGKGVITQTQSDSMLPTFAQDVAIIIGGVVLVLWSYIEKRSAGVLSSFFSALGRTASSVKLLPFALALSLGGSCALMSGCNVPSPTPGPAPVPTPGAPSAMKTWVDNNWLIFYDAGKYGSQAYVTYGVAHGSTAVQLAKDVQIGNLGLAALETGNPITSTQITSSITNAGGNAGAKSQTYAVLGSTISPFLAPALALVGSDGQAVAESIALIVAGANETANNILGTPSVTPTTNPYAPTSTTQWMPPRKDGQQGVSLVEIDL